MHAVNGFELPTVDLNRAATFYEKVLELSLRREVFLGVPHAIFPSEERAVGGALVKSENHSPSAKGTVVYLNAKDIDGCLARVASAGGSIAVPKTSLGPIGFFALVEDTEGNRVGLHMPA